MESKIDTIRETMISDVADVTENIDLSFRLLHENSWSKSRALDKLVEKEEREVQKLTKGSKCCGENLCSTCPICFSDQKIERLNGCPEDHGACTQCWSSFLSSQIDQGTFSCRCLHKDCKNSITISFTESHLNENSIKRLKTLLNRDFILNSKDIIVCKCNNITILEPYFLSSTYKVSCICGEEYCSVCRNEYHLSFSCDIVLRYKKEAQEKRDSIFKKRKLNNLTKNCPLCKVEIEKNGGCNLIHCTQCRKNFCWDCEVSFDVTHRCQNKIKRNAQSPEPNEIDYIFRMSYNDYQDSVDHESMLKTIIKKNTPKLTYIVLDVLNIEKFMRYLFISQYFYSKEGKYLCDIQEHTITQMFIVHNQIKEQLFKHKSLSEQDFLELLSKLSVVLSYKNLLEQDLQNQI